MPRTKKTTTATAEPQTISISEACKQFSTNEQNLRLALSHIRPDDFDTVKALPQADLHDLGKLINPPQLPATQATEEPQTSAHEENLETAETKTEQDTQTATEKPQIPPMSPLANRQSEQLTQSQGQGGNDSDLLTEIDRIIGEELTLSDAIGQVRNRVILHNLAAADSELAEELNQRHQARKAAYLNTVRGIASRKQDFTPLSPDATDIDTELEAIYNGLGK